LRHPHRALLSFLEMAPPNLGMGGPQQDWRRGHHSPQTIISSIVINFVFAFTLSRSLGTRDIIAHSWAIREKIGNSHSQENVLDLRFVMLNGI
jgi:hypothetical protein